VKSRRTSKAQPEAKASKTRSHISNDSLKKMQENAYNPQGGQIGVRANYRHFEHCRVQMGTIALSSILADAKAAVI
jgi:hypothetical protein